MRIDIFQDLICPWCYIGKRRLERALAQRPQRPVEARWQPFQLNPGMPREGADREVYLAAKMGGRERAAQINAAVTETAARDGLRFALGRIRRTPNTLDAHRLVRWSARDGGDPSRMTEALMRAYFTEARDIGQREVLADVAAEQGHGRSETLSMLAGEDGLAEIRESDASARRMGIQAVPCFVFERRYALSGAQEPKAFLPLLDLGAVGDDPAPASHAG